MKLLASGYPGWSDIWIRSGWRVQLRQGAGRLLDSAERLVHEGPRTECVAIGRGLAPRARRARAVILLHGLARSRRSMRGLAAALSARGWAVADAGYASLAQPFETHVRAVRAIREALAEDGAGEVSIVGHSLGGLIARQAMAAPDWPAGRLVLLGVPNRGSLLAERLSGLPFYRRLTGPCGQTVRPIHVGPVAVPDRPILNIAGGTGGNGWNPLLPGDDDGTVTVAETRLGSAETAFALVRSLHYRLPADAAAIAAALAFLEPARSA